MNIQQIKISIKDVIEGFNNNLQAGFSLELNPKMIGNILVSLPKQKETYRIFQIASVISESSREIMIKPWQNSNSQPIFASLQKNNPLGLDITQPTGNMIKLSLKPITQEY